MFPLANLLGTKFLYFLGSVLLAGVVSVGSGGTTGVNGGAIMVPDFTASGVASRTAKIPVTFPFSAFARSTGSLTVKYPASCFPNPLKAMGKGSGTLVRLTLHFGNSPAGVGGDVGLVKDCSAAGGSGSSIINDSCTGTGCTSTYAAGTLVINGDDFIKFTPRAPLTSAFTGRITGEIEDVWGE